MAPDALPVNTYSSPSSDAAGKQPPIGSRRYRARVPLSCAECTRRKIRCDKKIPCHPCVERGEDASCRRRGTPATTQHRQQHASGGPKGSDASISDLQAELQTLRGRLDRVESELSISKDRISEYPSEDNEPEAELRQDGLAGAMEEAALGIGQNRRWKGASLAVDTAPPVANKDEFRPFASISFQECLSKLPDRSQSNHLVTFYFDYLDWMTGCLHRDTLLHRHERFWELCSQGRLEDNMSVALIFAVLSVSCFFLDEQGAREAGIDPQKLHQLACAWFNCSISTFFRCEGMAQPSLAGCQTIFTLSHCFHLSGNTRIHVPISNMLVGFGRLMNLHLLGSGNSGSPEEILRREIGRRIWWQIVEGEWYFLPYHRYTSVVPCQFNTSLPDLTDDGRLASLSSDTHSLTFLLACCRSSRLLYDLYGSLEPSRFPTYDAVLSASRKLEQVVADLPPQLQQAAEFRQGGEAEESAAKLVYLRRFLSMMLAYRSYLIHRAYFAKSLGDVTYRVSRTACVRAAETILTISDSGLPATFYRLWNTTLWLVAAGVILSLDLLHAADGKKILPDLAARRRRLGSLIDLLQTLADNSGIGARGAKLISHLCRLEQEVSDGRQVAIAFTRDDINGFVRTGPAPPSQAAEQDGVVPGDRSTGESSVNGLTQPLIAFQRFQAQDEMETTAEVPATATASELDDIIFLPSSWGDFGQISGPEGVSFESFGPNSERNEFFELFHNV